MTKHGQPVARLAPVDDATPSTDASVTLLVDDDAAYFATGETWRADPS